MMPFLSESSPATLPVTTALGLPGMTLEWFRDPTTRAVMRVWININPADQSRHYVPEPGA